jgi:hypothetical protein
VLKPNDLLHLTEVTKLVTRHIRTNVTFQRVPIRQNVREGEEGPCNSQPGIAQRRADSGQRPKGQSAAESSSITPHNRGVACHPPGGTKSQISSTKSQTNIKHQIPPTKRAAGG